MCASLTLITNASINQDKRDNMPYLFTALVVVNAVVLSYFMFFYSPKPTENLRQAQAALVKPIEFENNSKELPALIGTKK